MNYKEQLILKFKVNEILLYFLSLFEKEYNDTISHDQKWFMAQIYAIDSVLKPCNNYQKQYDIEKLIFIVELLQI